MASATDTAGAPPAARPGGLSEEEAARRLASRPSAVVASSRSVGSIVRANVFTVFNLILVAFGVLTLLFGDARDALFLGVVIINAGIGIAQELRAKRALDRLAALVAPSARVVRDGRVREVGVHEVVPDDLLRLAVGDQVVADGHLTSAHELSLDESILTGESEPVVRSAGEEVRSGSFVVEGGAELVAEAVGEESHASRVAGEARAFRHPRSPLERSFNRLLLTLVAVMVPLGAILGYSLLERHASRSDAVSTSVAAVVSLIPEGLIVLTSVAYAVAAVRMARRGALSQQLNAIESLASVEVICLDKTGTLTGSSLRVTDLHAGPHVTPDELRAALGRFSASAPAQNLTLRAVADFEPQAPEAPRAEIPFSSRRRYSALELSDGTWYLGAPEHFALGALQARVDQATRSGRRVLALASSGAPLPARAPESPPPDLRLTGVVVLAEELRPQARETVAYFRSQGVELRVLSGDAPTTVAAIAADVGIEVSGGPLDGRELPAGPAELAQTVAGATVIGRISPEGKKAVVEALRDAGRYVAMVGDGVNDVPALKAARLAIAQGSGVQMAKSVADLVLVDGNFAAVPGMVAEGRKILRNLQRVAKLYVSKSSFAAFLILTVGTTTTAYPLLPRHFSLVAALTIGIPTFFLALAPSRGPWGSEHFLRDVGRFAIPAGAGAGVGVVASYQFALNALHVGLPAARTVAATVLLAVGLYLVFALEASGRRREAWVAALCAALAGAYVLALLTPWTRHFFSLTVPTAAVIATALVGAGIAIAALEATGLGARARGQP
ncbi:MAG: HAD family hydrolase [Actinobacteria bacterium]|nr:MAG: HAD family hydrolase [Actinomycetota bacterium]